jgi:large subunit ribosomal protein L5
MAPRLKQRFTDEVAPKLREQFAIANVMAQPRLEKIVLTVGLGKQLEGTKLNPKAKETTLKDLATISGQKAVVTKAKKSVSNFKVRAGYEDGAMVTLRGTRMWEFFDRLVSLAIPRIKDFRGLNPKSFDGRGNYSFGLTEQGVFPEVDMANTEFIHGLHVTFVIKNSDNDRSKFFLAEMGVPFSDKQQES